MAWTTEEDRKLKALAEAGDLHYTEIAKLIGRNDQSTRWRARKLGLVSYPCRDRIGQWNAKHAHMREPVMTYFVDHTFEETAKKFGLTHSELKSLTTVAYRQEAYRHLRKDTRTHNRWTTDELLFLLRHAGLRQRDWIAKQIKRGSARVIKEKLMSLRVNTKTLNGMTLSRFRSVFNCEPQFTISGDAGPTRGACPTTFKIVPWVEIDGGLKSGALRAPKIFSLVADSMANFQRWIHGDDPIESLRLAASSGHPAPNINRTYFKQGSNDERQSV